MKTSLKFRILVLVIFGAVLAGGNNWSIPIRVLGAAMAIYALWLSATHTRPHIHQ